MKNLLLLISFLLCSCSTTSVISTDYVNVNEDYAESDFFSSYTYIRLKASLPMISEISDLRMSDDKIFVSDKTSKLFVFSTQGDFIISLDKRGHGSNEYVETSDFDIKNDTIYILSRPQKKIFVYSINGNHIDTYELNDYYNGLRILSNNRICLASANSNNQNYNYIVYDIQKKSYINKFVPFTKNESMLLSCYHPFLGCIDDTMYINNPFSTEITELHDTEIGWTKSYVFNTEEQLPETTSDFTFEQLQKEFSNKRVVRNLLFYTKTRDFEYIGYELFGEYGLSFYLTQISKTNGSKTMMALNDIDKDFPYISLPYCTKSYSLISAMSAASILNIEHNYNLSKFSSEGLKDSDNPVIFIHKLK